MLKLIFGPNASSHHSVLSVIVIGFPPDKEGAISFTRSTIFKATGRTQLRPVKLTSIFHFIC